MTATSCKGTRKTSPPSSVLHCIPQFHLAYSATPIVHPIDDRKINDTLNSWAFLNGTSMLLAKVFNFTMKAMQHQEIDPIDRRTTINTHSLLPEF